MSDMRPDHATMQLAARHCGVPEIAYWFWLWRVATNPETKRTARRKFVAMERRR